MKNSKSVVQSKGLIKQCFNLQKDMLGTAMYSSEDYNLTFFFALPIFDA